MTRRMWRVCRARLRTSPGQDQVLGLALLMGVIVVACVAARSPWETWVLTLAPWPGYYLFSLWNEARCLPEAEAEVVDIEQKRRAG